ncbi:MAG: cytochrome c oxidase assembly protein [Betaproteobacteria bacterium]
MSDSVTVSGTAAQRDAARTTLKKLLLIVPVMLVFCASMVPLYRQICSVLGITATRAVAQNTQVDLSRTVRIEFDANVNRDFAWRFEPVEKSVDIHPGAVMTIRYRVTNTLGHPSTGRAVPSFGPLEAGQYFNKLECFCFSNQTLQAGETREMPVTFYVDPKLPKDIGSIALSYTFFHVMDEPKKS